MLSTQFLGRTPLHYFKPLYLVNFHANIKVPPSIIFLGNHLCSFKSRKENCLFLTNTISINILTYNKMFIYNYSTDCILCSFLVSFICLFPITLPKLFNLPAISTTVCLDDVHSYVSITMLFFF